MQTLFIGIAGPTGSGKTTVAEHLVEAMGPRAVLVQHDRYYRDRSDLSFEDRCALNFDHPGALETDLLVEHLNRLREGQAVGLPSYDFAAHRRRPDMDRVQPAPVVIVEGILVLAEESLRGLLDIKVWVETDPDIRVFRRIRRDIEQRGRTFESVREQYFDSVRPMTREFVEPSRHHADVIVPEGGENRVALDLLVARLRGFTTA